MSTPSPIVPPATAPASLESRVAALEAKANTWIHAHASAVFGIAGILIGFALGHFL